MAMKRIIKTGSVFLGLVLSTAALAAGDDRAALAHLLETFLDGASASDAAVHDRFWAEDLVYTSSDGRRFGKNEIMDSLAADDSADEPETTPEYSAREVAIRVFDDTAVVTFRLVAREDGQVVGEYFNTGVFRRRQPGWQAVTWQATRAADPADGE